MRRLLMLLALVLTQTGCATVVGGSRDPKVTVTSNPPGAAIWIDNENRGTTPAQIELSRKTEHKLTVVNDGFEPAQVTIRRKLNPWVFGNIVVGGLVGIVVDVCTDATYKLAPNEVHINLKPLASPPPQTSLPGLENQQIRQ